MNEYIKYLSSIIYVNGLDSSNVQKEAGSFINVENISKKLAPVDVKWSESDNDTFRIDWKTSDWDDPYTLYDEINRWARYWAHKCYLDSVTYIEVHVTNNENRDIKLIKIDLEEHKDTIEKVNVVLLKKYTFDPETGHRLYKNDKANKMYAGLSEHALRKGEIRIVKVKTDSGANIILPGKKVRGTDEASTPYNDVVNCYKVLSNFREFEYFYVEETLINKLGVVPKDLFELN